MLVAGMVVLIALIGIVFVLSPQVIQGEAQLVRTFHEPIQPIAHVKPAGRELTHGT
jgi:hypothetical protein